MTIEVCESAPRRSSQLSTVTAAPSATPPMIWTAWDPENRSADTWSEHAPEAYCKVD